MGNTRKLAALLVVMAIGVGLMPGCAVQEASEDKGGANTSGTPSGGEALANAGEEAAAAPSNVESVAPYPGTHDPDYPYRADPYNTEEYAAVDESGMVSAKLCPRSTFSADVDTASYGNLRRLIQAKTAAAKIPAGSVRIEEMLNYFDYAYPDPQGGDLFGFSSQVAPCPWNSASELLVMGFSTAAADYRASQGSNLVFLIDVSGSMSSKDKLPLLQESFSILVEQLSENDRVSIVTYSGKEQVVCQGVPGSDKVRLLAAINGLQASGSTNGSAGLSMAYDLAEKALIEGGNNRIVMASDGDLNVGITSTGDLHDFVAKKRAGGVYLSVLGFGTGNYKDTKMETLADNGNGAYHYIDSLNEARKVFGRDLCANLVTLAKDVKMQVEFNPSVVQSYRLIGYDNRRLADEDFLDSTVDAGEVGHGHQVTVAYEIVRTGGAVEKPVPPLKYQQPHRPGESGETEGDAASGEWLTCSVRYKTADSGVVVENRHVVDEASYSTAPGDDWRFAAAVIETGLVLQQSGYKGSASLPSAQKLLQDTGMGDAYRQEFAHLLDLCIKQNACDDASAGLPPPRSPVR